jgi:hypothetical protein
VSKRTHPDNENAESTRCGPVYLHHQADWYRECDSSEESNRGGLVKFIIISNDEALLDNAARAIGATRVQSRSAPLGQEAFSYRAELECSDSECDTLIGVADGAAKTAKGALQYAIDDPQKSGWTSFDYRFGTR